MTTLVNWTPAHRHLRRRRFFNEFDRMFDNFTAPTNWGFPVDVLENEDGYTVKASVPGFSPDNLDITLEENVLTIKAESASDENVEEEKYHIRERRFGSFSRSIRFPVDVKAGEIEAAYEQGVLTLTVPKAEEVKPKRIEIKVS
ncbi:MAG: Hsp20/alpha crystallin family protein [Anaerolineae bacterium]